MYKRISLIAVLVVLMALLNACVTTETQTPEVVIETVEVPVEVEKPVEVIVEVTPVPVEEVKIGVVWPLTGSIGQYGAENRHAAELATDIINNIYPELGDFPFANIEGLPNLGGAKWAPVFADHQSKPELGTTEMERLITEENVVAAVGCFNSSVSIAARVVNERYGIPMVNDISSSARLNEERAELGLEWYFSITPDDGDNAVVFFNMIDDMNEQMDAGIETIALIHDNVEMGMAGAEVNTQLAEERGYTIVEDVAYEPGTTELTGEVTKLKLSEPDVVLFNHTGPAECEAYFKTSKDLDFNPRVFQGGIGCSYGTLFESLGEDAEYFLARESFSLDLAAAQGSDVVLKINDMYRLRSGGTDLSANTARAFMGQIVLATIINNAGSTDPEAIKAAAEALDMPPEQLITPWLGIKFDPVTGKNIHATAVLVQVQNAAWRLVYPFEVAAVDLIWPWPMWDER